MGILDFFSSEKQNNNQNNLFSKSELENLIQILSKISYIFQESGSIIGGRSEKMMSTTRSYAGILGYFYEIEYGYGKMIDIVDNNIANHYLLVKSAMFNNEHKKRTISELSNNWSDILQVIFNFELDSNPIGNKFKTMQNDIQKVTEAFEKLSGTKCRKPQNPLDTKPKNITYNPYNITEDPMLSRGHTIPDITSVFAQELIPLLSSAQSYGRLSKDTVANYAISMVKSYYENAGFVPMVIIDQITGQINQVTDMFQKISYSPYSSLKEYVLSKIYR